MPENKNEKGFERSDFLKKYELEDDSASPFVRDRGDGSEKSEKDGTAIEKLNTDDGKLGGDVKIKIKSPIVTWLENFFYHYKWHVICGAVAVFFLTFCILQTCSRTTFDSYILYAGGKNLRVTAEGEAEATFTPIYQAAQRFVPDFDENGERNISFLDIYLPSSEEIKALESGKEGVNHSLLAENGELFRTNMLTGEYYICLISKPLFDEWTKNEENNPFVKISLLLPEGAKIAENAEDDGYLLASEWGVYLSSTPTGDNPGFKNLPVDTILCFRKLPVMSSGASKKANQAYENAKEVFINILSDEAYS